MVAAIRVHTESDQGFPDANEPVTMSNGASGATEQRRFSSLLHGQYHAKFRFAAHHSRVAFRGLGDALPLEDMELRTR
jgi:hypothetical protein